MAICAPGDYIYFTANVAGCASGGVFGNPPAWVDVPPEPNFYFCPGTSVILNPTSRSCDQEWRIMQPDEDALSVDHTFSSIFWVLVWGVLLFSFFRGWSEGSRR